MKFEELYEKYAVYKQVKREFYPKQISFSPEFLSALKEEYSKQQVDENKKPINNKRIKFVKALNFHLRDLDNKTVVENLKQSEILKKEVALKKQVDKKINTNKQKRLKQNLGHE